MTIGLINVPHSARLELLKCVRECDITSGSYANNLKQKHTFEINRVKQYLIPIKCMLFALHIDRTFD